MNTEFSNINVAKDLLIVIIERLNNPPVNPNAADAERYKKQKVIAAYLYQIILQQAAFLKEPSGLNPKELSERLAQVNVIEKHVADCISNLKDKTFHQQLVTATLPVDIVKAIPKLPVEKNSADNQQLLSTIFTFTLQDLFSPIDNELWFEKVSQLIEEHAPTATEPDRSAKEKLKQAVIKTNEQNNTAYLTNTNRKAVAKLIQESIVNFEADQPVSPFQKLALLNILILRAEQFNLLNKKNKHYIKQHNEALLQQLAAAIALQGRHDFVANPIIPLPAIANTDSNPDSEEYKEAFKDFKLPKNIFTAQAKATAIALKCVEFIVTSRNHNEAALRMEQTIILAHELLNKGFFDGYYAIMSTLVSNSSVSRLKTAIASLSPYATQLMNDFTKITDPHNNDYKMRKLLKSVEENNSSFVPSSVYIFKALTPAADSPVAARLKIVELVKSFHQYREIIQAELKNSPQLPSLHLESSFDEAAAYAHSLRLEPRKIKLKKATIVSKLQGLAKNNHTVCEQMIRQIAAEEKKAIAASVKKPAGINNPAVVPRLDRGIQLDAPVAGDNNPAVVPRLDRGIQSGAPAASNNNPTVVPRLDRGNQLGDEQVAGVNKSTATSSAQNAGNKPQPTQLPKPHARRRSWRKRVTASQKHPSQPASTYQSNQSKGKGKVPQQKKSGSSVTATTPVSNIQLPYDSANSFGQNILYARDAVLSNYGSTIASLSGSAISRVSNIFNALSGISTIFSTTTPRQAEQDVLTEEQNLLRKIEHDNNVRELQRNEVFKDIPADQIKYLQQLVLNPNSFLPIIKSKASSINNSNEKRLIENLNLFTELSDINNTLLQPLLNDLASIRPKYQKADANLPTNAAVNVAADKEYEHHNELWKMMVDDYAAKFSTHIQKLNLLFTQLARLQNDNSPQTEKHIDQISTDISRYVKEIKLAALKTAGALRPPVKVEVKNEEPGSALTPPPVIPHVTSRLPARRISCNVRNNRDFIASTCRSKSALPLHVQATRTALPKAKIPSKTSELQSDKLPQKSSPIVSQQKNESQNSSIFSTLGGAWSSFVRFFSFDLSPAGANPTTKTTHEVQKAHDAKNTHADEKSHIMGVAAKRNADRQHNKAQRVGAGKRVKNTTYSHAVNIARFNSLYSQPVVVSNVTTTADKVLNRMQQSGSRLRS